MIQAHVQLQCQPSGMSLAAPQRHFARRAPMTCGISSQPRRGSRHGRCRGPLRPQRQLVPSASGSDDLGIVKTEELRDGSILFSFGDAADSTSAASAAADGGGPAVEAAKAAAAAPEDSAAAARPAAAPQPEPEAEAAHAAEEVEPSAESNGSSTEDAASEPAATSASAGSPTQSLDKEQLHELKVAELKELCRENDLKGYSTMRKNELVDFIIEALPGDYQI